MSNGVPPLLRLRRTDAPDAVVLIRLAVGSVFLSEGLQKWIRPDTVGAGRFAAIGIPWPDVVAPLVGAVEVTCGALILLGAFTRLAALPLILVMIGALLSTKVPIGLGRGYWLFAAPRAGLSGLWDLAHESRTDVAMLLSSVFLARVGAGPWSVDARLVGRAPEDRGAGRPEPARASGPPTGGDARH